MRQKRLCLFTSRFGLCSVVLLKELWHGNIVPQEDSRTNSKEMKELLGYMARHHEDLAKTFTDEQKEIFEKFHVAKSETIEYRFGRVKPPKARSWRRRASTGDRQRLCDGGERLGRVRKPLPKQPSSNTPSASERGSQWRYRRTWNGNEL